MHNTTIGRPEMISTATKPTILTPLSSGTKCPSPEPQHLKLQESILRLNDDGVSLLKSGKIRAAVLRLQQSLTIMRTRAVEGDREVHYQFANSLRENGRIFAAPLEIVPPPTPTAKDTEEFTCKILSLVLYNLSLAYHLYALELDVTIQHDLVGETKQRELVCAFLDKTLRLYELCHSSLIFANSGLCSDISIGLVVTNNVGEIHKELNSKTTMACSEQVVQIFMFFAASGSSNRLDGLEDILSNALATLNPQTVAPAA